jgi:hypothetical protein
LIDSVQGTIDACRDALTELDGFVSKALSPGNGSKIAAQAKFTFIFKDKDLSILQANVDRFEAPLKLILSVVQFAVLKRYVHTLFDCVAL